MAQLAIKGHKKRGNELIEILAMLGGSNVFGLDGNNPLSVYYVNESYKDYITCSNGDNIPDYVIFTLEEFLEKFPYKVGDKVQHKGATSCGSVFEVEKMRWMNNRVEYTVKGLWNNNCHSVAIAEDLQPFEKENLTIQDIRDNNAEWLLNKLQEMSAEGALQTISDLYDELHTPQYPNTYKECFNICFGNHHPVIQVVGLDGLGNNKELFGNFIKLKICRDAYWKIVGEQMGLGKPWKPKWNNDLSKCYISFYNNKVDKGVISYSNKILAFPTEEMRDAFYENFKDLIEQCKELL